MEPVNRGKVDCLENLDVLENNSDQPNEYFHIITRKNSGKGHSSTNSQPCVKKYKKRGRKTSTLPSNTENGNVGRTVTLCESSENASKGVPYLMVNERGRRKKSSRFREYLEVIKGEKDFYIDQSDELPVSTSSNKGKGRRKKEVLIPTSEVSEVPVHHIFSDGHLSVLAQSIDEVDDNTCVIHVKESLVDLQENFLHASVEEDTGLLVTSIEDSSKFINTIELDDAIIEDLNFGLNSFQDLRKPVKSDINVEETLLAISEYENNVKSLQLSESQNGILLQIKNEGEENFIDEDLKSDKILPELETGFLPSKTYTADELEKNYRCKLCTEKFHTFEDAKRHAKTFHSSAVFEATNKEWERSYRCPECERTFPTEKGRNKHHLLMHLKNKPGKCPDCGTYFNSFRPLERHLKSVHDRNPMSFCDICEEEFVLGVSLEHHIYISHPPKSKLNMDGQYSKHVRRVVQCPFCDKKIIGSKTFRWHHSKVHNGKPFPCKQCKYKTFSMSMFKRHLATVHKALHLLLYVCADCKAGYQTPQDLEDHYISAHNKNSIHFCPFCGEKFACMEMLRFHKGKHRAYTCDFCPLGFMKPETLEEHLSTVHKHDLSKEAETLFEEININASSSSTEKERNADDNASASTLLNAVNTKILEIQHDGSVEVKENILPLVSEETDLSPVSTNKVHHLHNTKDGNLQELDVNDPLKDFRLKDLPKKINCPICSKLLTTKFLKTHMRSHVGSLPHKCPKCLKSYAQTTLVRKHMKSKHYEDFLKLENKMPKKKKVQCEYCELIFDDIYLLEDHLWSHMDTKTYECEMCHIKFGMKINWMEHYKTHYFKGEKPCPTCDRSFKTVGYYREHVERCQSNWICEECGFKCENPEIYRKHKKLEHSDGTSVFRCQHCKKNFFPKTSYEDHLISHSSIKHFPCNHCTKEFKRKKPLLDHISKVHVKPQLVCSYCSMSFDNQSELNSHTRDHRRQQMTCEECGVVYLSRQTLDNHIAVYHDVLTQDPFICVLCSEMFQKQIELKLHLQKHSTEAVYVCQVNRCHKIFRKEQILRGHMARRHSYLEYFCPFCDRKFLLDSDLQKHTETHNERLIFSCNACKFIGTNKTDLNAHKIKYHDDKLYECSICETQLSKKDEMVTHVTNVHNKNNPLCYILARRWKCSLCEKSFLVHNTFVKHLEQHTVHGISATGVLTKLPLVDHQQSFMNQPVDNTISLNCEDLLPLLKVEFVAKGAVNDKGEPLRLQTDNWQCLSCLFIANSEEDIKNHINDSYDCLRKLEGILTSRINNINFETRIVDECSIDASVETSQEDNTSENPQFILIDSNFTNEPNLNSKDSMILMDNNLQLVLNTDFSDFLDSPIVDTPALPILEIQDNKLHENKEIIEQTLPLEINHDILSDAGVLIQTEDGRLVIQEIGETGPSSGMVQYQLVKEKTNDQGTIESTYEILEPDTLPVNQISGNDYQYP